MRHGLSRMIVRLSRPAIFCWDLSRLVTFRPGSATSIKFWHRVLRLNVDDVLCLNMFVPSV